MLDELYADTRQRIGQNVFKINRQNQFYERVSKYKRKDCNALYLFWEQIKKNVFFSKTFSRVLTELIEINKKYHCKWNRLHLCWQIVEIASFDILRLMFSLSVSLELRDYKFRKWNKASKNGPIEGSVFSIKWVKFQRNIFVIFLNSWLFKMQ